MARDIDSVEDLQAHVAYNERMINDLSEVVVAQGRELDRLRAEIEVLGRQLLEITEGEAGSH
jgi:uncharacterized coiled-coil protein SlyX